MSLKLLERVRKTIGLQLTLWYSGIFILCTLILFVLIYFFISSSLQQKDRMIIQIESEEFAAEYQKNGLDGAMKEMQELESENNVHPEENYFVRFADHENKLIFLHIPDPSAEIDLKQLESSTATDSGSWSELPTKDNKDTYEILSNRLPNGFVLQVGNSTTPRKEFLAHFRSMFAAILIPMILISFSVGAFLTFRVLRPIRYLINTTRLIINTGKRDVRIPTGQGGNELDELSTLFNSMLEKIETLIKGMREGLDNVAHDLRTPVARLRGIAEMALQSDQNIDTLRETLSDCIEDSGEILVILNTLMDISEAEAGATKLVLEEVNLSNLIEEMDDLYRHVAEEKKISVHTNVPRELYLTADHNRVRRVIANLLDNALKYTPDSGRIDIEAFQSGQQIIISIKDTGIGIHAEELPRIWDRLYRVEKSRSQRGLGLGLAFVKAIVEAHKGYVEVSSEPGAGSLFAVHFPVKP